MRQLELLPEHHVFALFMGLHIYLYLHAQLSADMTADVTRMARDDGYRSEIEREVERHAGLPVSFADAAESEHARAMSVDVGAIDWAEIRAHARVAVRMLSPLADPARLATDAAAFVDSTIEEMRRTAASSARGAGWRFPFPRLRCSSNRLGPSARRPIR
ncbi:MAG: hypothetical protein ACREHV_16190 [Rhizomicrobium sp.]